jgi:uncharacterized protein (DUF2236 family)
MGKLLDLVAGCEPATASVMQDATLLTPFGVEVRYPGDSPELLAGEEARAIEIARQARHAVHDLSKGYLNN